MIGLALEQRGPGVPLAESNASASVPAVASDTARTALA
jgi:hypothetical protein